MTQIARQSRMPAEWEPHEATWLSWPRVQSYSFPFNLEQVRPAFLEMIRALATGEEVWINVSDREEISWISERLSSPVLARVRFFEIPTNEAWCRDHGPTFVVAEDGQRVAISWEFNSWGGKYPPYAADAAAGKQMAAATDTPCFHSSLVMEGGAIESNGAGDILTSRSCLLSASRNPDIGAGEVENIFADCLGATNTLWLEGALIQGDDTDGHVDMTSRFTAEDRILAALPTEKSSPDYEVLVANIAELRQLRTAAGNAPIVETLPILPPFYNSGFWAPRIYTNFYIANGCVLVPSYRVPEDEQASEVLQRHFPDRTIIPIDCREIIKGHGALHCLTQQVPQIR